MNTLQLTIRKNTKEIQVAMSGDIVSIDAFELRYALATLVSKGQDLVLDLLNVKEISITGLNALLMTKIALHKQGSKMNIIVNQESQLFRYLHLTKMQQEFNIFYSEAQKIAA